MRFRTSSCVLSGLSAERLSCSIRQCEIVASGVDFQAEEARHAREMGAHCRGSQLDMGKKAHRAKDKYYHLAKEHVRAAIFFSVI